MSAPGWPPAVIRVPYGPTHYALPEFLCSLAITATSPLAPGPAPDGVNSEFIPSQPAHRRAANRDRPRRLGGTRPAPLHDHWGARHGQNRKSRWPRPMILRSSPGLDSGASSSVLSIGATRSAPFYPAGERTGAPQQSQHTTAPWPRSATRAGSPQRLQFSTTPGIDRKRHQAETSRLLGLLRDTPGLSFAVTSRVGRGCLIGWEPLDHLSPLTFTRARSLFRGIATSIQPDDPDLQPFLEALDGHALSITIMATRSM